MKKIETITKIIDSKIVAVVRGKNEEEVLKTIEAIVAGGIKIIEITFTIPHAERIIETVAKHYENRPDVVIGAGTCLDIVAARNAISAGAAFVVCPHFDQEIVELCNGYTIPVMPGATTVKDMIACLKAGASIVKLFPADNFGPAGIKAFKGPLPYVEIMPTGGISADNIIEWLKHGAIAVGTGGSLTKGAKTGDFEAVTREALKLTQLVENYKNECC